MLHEDDTIAAISTPAGQGGIGIVRLSGPGALVIADKIFRPDKPCRIADAAPFSMRHGHVIDPVRGEEVDEVLVSVMRSPHSYTREDIVEINCHGGMVPIRNVLDIILTHGARLAEPGEFTRRAFLNGRLSLSQAEAVMDLIASRTEESRRIALAQLKGGLSAKISALCDDLMESCAFAEAYIDFPEDDIGDRTREQMTGKLAGISRELGRLSSTFEEARFFREGLSVAIVGRPNVGKSSLLNTFLNKDRAIVTPVPGTTRDVIEECLNINGLPVRIMDTAGIRHSDETVEKEGIRRSIEAIEHADLIIAMFDGSEPLRQDDLALLDLIRDKDSLIVINKSDLTQKISLENLGQLGKQYLHISASGGEGMEELKSAIFSSHLKNWKEEREGVVVTNMRHKLALDRARTSLEKAVQCLNEDQPLEIFSIELRDALDRLGEISGAVTTEDILDRIFRDFCIGK